MRKTIMIFFHDRYIRLEAEFVLATKVSAIMGRQNGGAGGSQT